MATKPVTHIDWLEGNPDPASRILDPGALAVSGYSSGDTPVSLNFNWLLYYLDQWDLWAESQLDAITDATGNLFTGGVATLGPAGGGTATPSKAHTARADAVSAWLVNNTSTSATAVAINMLTGSTVRSRWAASSTSALQVSDQAITNTILNMSQTGTLQVTYNDGHIRAANAANNAGAFMAHRQSDGSAIWGALGSSGVVFRINSADRGGIDTSGQMTLTASLLYSTVGMQIRSNKADGADNTRLFVSGGGAGGDSTRGGNIVFHGNEFGNSIAGQLHFIGGDASESSGSNKTFRWFGCATTGGANAETMSLNGAGQLIIGASGGSQIHRINGSTTTAVGAAGGATALPATPAGYLEINVNGTNRRIPYYNT